MSGSIDFRRWALLVALGSLLFVRPGTAHATTYLDQWFDPLCNVNTVSGFTGPPGPEYGQTFLPTVSGPLTRVDVYMSNNPPPLGSVFMDIRGTVAGVPDPAITPAGVLATTSVLGSTIPSAPAKGWITFLFPVPANIVAGVEYTIVLRPVVGSSTYGWWGSSPSGYPQGGLYQRNVPLVPVWSPLPGISLGFRTFVGPAPYPAVPAPCTPSPPPGVFGGTSTGSGGGGGGGMGGAAGSGSEGSFAGTQDPASGSEGAFGATAHLTAQMQASPNVATPLPILVGPFMDIAGGQSSAQATAAYANAPPTGANLLVFNASFRQSTAANGQPQNPSDLESALIWALLVALLLGATMALVKVIQGVVSVVGAGST